MAWQNKDGSIHLFNDSKQVNYVITNIKNQTGYKSIIKLIKYTAIIFCTLGICAKLSNYHYSEPMLLHHSQNEFGGVWVHEINNHRYLRFAEDSIIVQSKINLSFPDAIQLEYQKMLLGGLFLSERLPEKILVIGLGGGSLAKAINKAFPSVNLDIVEINPVIPKLAQEYFEFNPNANTRVFVEDGYEFIKNSESNKYDLVILDACDKDYFPPAFLTTAFVKRAREILTSNGIMAINSFVGSQFNELEDKIYGTEFGKYHSLTNQGNRIILVNNSELFSCDQIKQRSVTLEQKLNSIGVDTSLILNKFKSH